MPSSWFHFFACCVLTNNISALDYPRAWLKRDAEALSDALRARTVEPVTGRRLRRIERRTGKLDEAAAQQISLEAPPIEYNKHQAMAYVAHRIPGIYGCNTKVFDEIKKRFPGFAPKRMMDFGSGPGTTTWAASQMWPSIRRFQLVEPSESMVAVSTKILDGFPVERRNFLHQGRPDKFDLIVASYSLSELADDSSRRLHVLSIWEHLEPGGLLIIVEPGTPVGFKVVRQIRSALMELGESSSNEATKPTIVGPCPHAHRCPMSQTTWCHFVQRVERSATLRATKSGTQNWENEKFSYMAISKGPLAGELELPDTHPNKGLPWSRLIRQPLKRGGHVLMDLCLPNGAVERLTASRKHGKELYTAARKSTWGDMFYVDHLVDAEEEVAQHDRRKWRERKIDAKNAKVPKSDISDDILSSELARLGLDK